MLSRRRSSRNFMLIDTPDRNSCDVYRRCGPSAPFLLEFDFTVGVTELNPTWLGVWWNVNTSGYVTGSSSPQFAAPLTYVEVGSYDGLTYSQLYGLPGFLPLKESGTPSATITVTQAGEIVVPAQLLYSDGDTGLYQEDYGPAYAFDTSLTYHATIVALP